MQLVVLAALAAGCSGSSGSDVTGSGSGDSPTGSALFATSGDATPDSIYGVWGGVATSPEGWSFDSRLRLAERSAVFAQRCQSPEGKQGAIVSVSVKARVSDDEIAILESKRDERTLGDVTCRANATPVSASRCTASDDGFERNCFRLDGTTLTIYGASPLDKVALTKISD